MWASKTKLNRRFIPACPVSHKDAGLLEVTLKKEKIFALLLPLLGVPSCGQSFVFLRWWVEGRVENTSAQLSSLPANAEAAAGALLSADLISSIHMCGPRGWVGLRMQTGNFRPFLSSCHRLRAQQPAVSLHTKTGLVRTELGG